MDTKIRGKGKGGNHQNGNKQTNVQRTPKFKKKWGRDDQSGSLKARYKAQTAKRQKHKAQYKHNDAKSLIIQERG
jgi:hypothetical protein